MIYDYNVIGVDYICYLRDGRGSWIDYKAPALFTFGTFWNEGSTQGFLETYPNATPVLPKEFLL